MSRSVLAVTLTLVVFWASAGPAHAQGSNITAECAEYLETNLDAPFSVIFTADPGDFSGTAEAKYLLHNLKDNTTVSRNKTVCGNHFTGMLMGQAAVVITTGIGPVAAGVCGLEVLMKCGADIKDIIYFGTSGWSSQLGGTLNPPDCSAVNDNGLITRLGDICVSPLSVNWGCEKASWVQQAGGYPNECYRPAQTNSPNSSFLFGKCQYYADNLEANLAFSDEVLAAAEAALTTMPQPNTKASSNIDAYWALFANQTGLQYVMPNSGGLPKLWNYTQCMETDAQLFYAGVPFEIKRREFLSEVMSLALNMTILPTQVIAVSAMEAVGLSDALSKYHAMTTTTRYIPFTNVRSASDWLHQPVKQVEKGIWRIMEELPEDFATGYAYAIATGSATILSLFKARCEAMVTSQQLAPGFDCSFTIDYS